LVGASLLHQRKREVSVFVLDLSARQRAEAILRQQWRTFDTALSHTPDFTYIFDLEGRFTYVNRALLSLWQKTLEEAVGKSFFELGYPSDLATRLQRQIQEVIESREALRDDTPFTGPTGETRYYEYIFVPVLSAGGVVEAVAGSTRDITDRRRDQEALRKSEERLTFALEAGGGVGTWDWDLTVDRLYNDARFAQLFSVDPSPGAPFSSYLNGIHPDDRERVARAVLQAIASGEDYVQEYRLLPRDGAVRWVFARGRCHRDETGQPVRFPGVVIDITDRKRAEEAVLDSEARFRFLAETIPQMVWTTTAEGQLDYVSSQGTEYFGLPQAALLGTGWLSCVHPEDREQTVERWAHSLATGDPYEVAFRLRRGSDGSFRWHLARALPLIGEVVQWFGTCTEIEDQKVIEAELTRTNRELEEFAYVASHDLQEPMRMVNIYTQLILMEVGDSHPSLKEYGGFVREGVGRMQALIHDLLTFSRTVHKDELPAGVADLSLSLTEALSVLDNRIRQSGANITVQFLPTVVGDTAQLAHVFQNLLSNALKYARSGTPPRIDICAAADGDHWIVSVQDNGIGFEPQYAERIFGLFKRLHKDEYEGTGLGLAICRRIVERYGGRMWAEGRPREGATFFFALPDPGRALGRQT
jgi:PAS domain S-box-containing protein